MERKHLKVYHLLNDVQTERTDWTVSNGNMVFATAPADDTQIVIVREVPLTQETDYRENEVLPAETLEKNFDKLTLITQQLAEENKRAIKVSMFSDADPSSLANEIEILYAIRDKISTVVQNKSDINTTAANISDVNTAAANMAAIQAAPTQASNAATSATNAQMWAEGSDADVAALGGTHSAKEWAALAGNMADKDLSNLSATGENHFASNDASIFSSTGKSFLSGLGLPDTYIDLLATGDINSTVTSTAQQYVAPANGWVCAGSSSAERVIIAGRQSYKATQCGINVGVYTFLPVAKGETVSFYCGSSSTLVGCTFCYNKGEV